MHSSPLAETARSSPLWALALLAILLWPVVLAIVNAIRRRPSGAPKNEHTLEASSMMQSLKDWIDTRTGGKGF